MRGYDKGTLKNSTTKMKRKMNHLKNFFYFFLFLRGFWSISRKRDDRVIKPTFLFLFFGSRMISCCANGKRKTYKYLHQHSSLHISPSKCRIELPIDAVEWQMWLNVFSLHIERFPPNYRKRQMYILQHTVIVYPIYIFYNL